MKQSDVNQLLSSPWPELKDPSTLTTSELLAEVAVIDRRMKLLNKLRLELLESSPDIVAAHPELKDELEYLRTLGLQEVSGPGS